MKNLSINIGQDESTCQQRKTNSKYYGQPSQHTLKPEQKVYLYGDTRFTGTLIRPIERTYPHRWTVQLDRGGYDSAMVSEITLFETSDIESELEIPFSDEPSSIISQKEREIIALKTKLKQLEAENEILKKDLAQAKQVIRRAKDITPLMRISLKRVLRLAHDAGDERTAHRRRLDTQDGRQSKEVQTFSRYLVHSVARQLVFRRDFRLRQTNCYRLNSTTTT